MTKFGEGNWVGDDMSRLKQEIDSELKTLRDIDEKGMNPNDRPYNGNRFCFHLLNDIREEAKKHYDIIMTSFPDSKDKFLAEWIKQFFNLENKK